MGKSQLKMPDNPVYGIMVFNKGYDANLASARRTDEAFVVKRASQTFAGRKDPGMGRPITTIIVITRP